MPVSVFELFSVGVGPSSSHTVGPMRAAASFVELVGERVDELASVRVDVFGSLAATGRGHGTFDAILLGLEGCKPEEVEANDMDQRKARMAQTGAVRFGDVRDIKLTEDDMVKRPLTVLKRHTNAMTLTAFDAAGEELAKETYYSVGGGFVVAESDENEPIGGELHTPDVIHESHDHIAGTTVLGEDLSQLPEEEVATEPSNAETGGAGSEGTTSAPVYEYASAADLLRIAKENDLALWEIVMANELQERTEDEIREGLLHIYSVMDECAMSSLDRTGYLPGGLKVKRRAHDWFLRLKAEDPHNDPKFYQEWVNLIALAVNEENASGGRVVTAPTNGAAGIIPAVMYYALHFVDRVVEAGPQGRADAIVEFLLTAAAIGGLYKEKASISGAEVGCQGEVGSASSMAAGALAQVMGGTPEQVENAAEIAMEHNLGLTCDPIAGLVQVPCIERNAIAAGKAINAAKMALWGDGTHRVSLDEVIETMRSTGEDMSHKYKETAMGGLAVNVVEC
ncbi:MULTISPECIES: L-serine ammonia-lyase [Brevibacterium]|uniref:L-serine dehydratase n=1 Tax=Brevibacterium paucivorans TaxID=170994 RepID=A0A2N6VKW8_9MICO|nr:MULTISPECIES: L-serine ammonia-lyase [Brevibacterium]MCG7299462.1 L-serine ammonia-lyase [Brevibacterium sp. ACRRH]PMD04653.1 L-serine ammonia-lyase [Brevibacterium paucivorans]